MVTEIKMMVTPDLSERVQKIVFSGSGSWIDGYKEISDLKSRYLYINKKGRLSLGNDENYFINHRYEEISAYDFIASQGEQKWLPKFSEKVEFSNDKKEWEQGIFNCYIPTVRYSYFDNYLSAWKYCRPIKQTKTIIIDGKNIEISKESFESLKQQLLKGE